MKIIHNIATFMHTADLAFWHEKMNTNRYFATVSVLFALLAGIITPRAHSSVRDWLARSFLKWEVYPSFLAAIGVMILLVTLNVGESIIGSKNFVSGLLRSLWMTIAIAFAFFLGCLNDYVMAIVLFVMVAILLVEMLMSLGTVGRSFRRNR